MQIWLVRHGQTDWNVEEKIQGWTDIPLNNHGRAQAQHLAAILATVPFVAAYSSDLVRAYETAQIITSGSDLIIQTSNALREQQFGKAEGEFRSAYENLSQIQAEGAETRAAVIARVSSFLTDCAKKHHHGNVLVVTHGGVIRATLDWLQHEHDHIPNTSITRLDFDNEQFVVHSHAQTPHLKERD